MPHAVVLYTPNLEADSDMSALCRHLATASEDGTARIWAATPEGFLIQACQYLHPWPAYAKVAEACAPYLDRTP